MRAGYSGSERVHEGNVFAGQCESPGGEKTPMLSPLSLPSYSFVTFVVMLRYPAICDLEININ